MGDDKLLREIGERICEIRKKRRLTQEELAEKMDVSIQMISNLERGKKAIRPENIVKLCEVLEVSTEYVLRGIASGEDVDEIAKKLRLLSLEQQEAVEKIVDLFYANR